MEEPSFLFNREAPYPGIKTAPSEAQVLGDKVTSQSDPPNLTKLALWESFFSTYQPTLQTLCRPKSVI